MDYSPAELKALGITFGKAPRVHKTVQFFNADKVVLGDDVRIDCFSLLSAGAEGIRIGRNVHLAASVFLYGSGGKIEIHDFAGLSARVTLYTANDDYTGEAMTNPTVPDEFRKVKTGPVTVGKHVVIGSGAVVLPNVILHPGVAVGALSLVNKSVPEFTIVSGVPVQKVGTRRQDFLRWEKALVEKERL